MTECDCLGEKCMCGLSRLELELEMNNCISQQHYLSAKILDIQQKLYWDNYMTQEEFSKFHKDGVEPKELTRNRNE